MNTKKASQLAGIAAIISGVLYAAIQFIHPANELSSLSTNTWMVAHVFNFLFPIFGLFGLTGIYLKQVKSAGYLGLVGYIALFSAFSLMLCFAFYEAFIAPVLITEAPTYVTSALLILEGEAGPQYLGQIYQVNGLLYLLGGLLFGIATLKANIFPRWAGAILVLGVAATLGAAVLPLLARPSAVIFGLGFAALGYILTTRKYTSTKS